MPRAGAPLYRFPMESYLAERQRASMCSCLPPLAVCKRRVPSYSRTSGCSACVVTASRIVERHTRNNSKKEEEGKKKKRLTWPRKARDSVETLVDIRHACLGARERRVSRIANIEYYPRKRTHLFPTLSLLSSFSVSVGTTAR